MAERTVRIFADSTCDLSDELIKKYNITIVPLCIVIDNKSYFDKSEITPEEIFDWADKNNKIPKTAAISFDYFKELVAPHMEADEDVIFFGISEDMSTTCNVARLVGQEFEKGRLFVINSMNLSTGIGLQVIRAAELLEQGKTAEEIVSEIESLRSKVRASFVVDTLTYLARGGRCTAVAALLGNTLKLHPSIKVIDGKMTPRKKYRGKISKALADYSKDLKEELLNADKKRVFITYSKIDPEIPKAVREFIESLNYFEEIFETEAGGVISSHCGPGTLGILFYAV